MLPLGPVLRRACNRKWPLASGLRSYSSPRKGEIHFALGCNVYVSEGRDKRVIDHLKAEAEATHGVALANLFVDEPYHRTGFTFVSDQPDRLTAAVVRLSRAALQLLDLRCHDATHPRLGVVDHISLHPLGSLVAPSSASPFGASSSASFSASSSRQSGAGGATSSSQHHQQQQQHHHREQHQRQHAHAQPWTQVRYGSNGEHGAVQQQQLHQQQQQLTVWEPPPPGLRGLAVAASCAQDIAWCLSGVGDSEEPDGLTQQDQQQQTRGSNPAASGGSGLEAIPVYLYGYAHSSRRSLSEVRRQLGYFKSSPDGGWHGVETHKDHLSDDVLRYPPDLGPSEAPPQSGLATVGAVPWVVNYNIPLVGVELQEARWLARALSERGGSMQGVEAIALKHADESDVEVACNLLDAAVSPPALVQSRLEALASMRGLRPDQVMAGYRTNRSPEELLRAAMADAARWRG